MSLMLLVAGCSSGSAGNAAVKRGPCPKVYPSVSRRFSLKEANAGVDGLDASLVPFPAQQVRVCSYNSRGDTLTGTALLKQAVATRFEASTNQLRTTTSRATTFLTCRTFDESLLTFTTAKEGMAVAVADCGSGIANNGTLTVDSTRAWLDEIATFTAKPPKAG